MVTCGNCGAQYDENEKVCPYCGAENVPVSIKEQSDYLQGISRKKALLNTVIPQEKAKRAEKKVHRTALVLVAFFLLFALMAAGYSIVRTKQKRYNQQEALRILEEYYVNNDYEGMSIIGDMMICTLRHMINMRSCVMFITTILMAIDI